MRSPLRKEANPSFCAWYKNGSWAWKDYGLGKGGNVISFYREYTGSSHPVSDLYSLWFENGNTPKPMKPPKEEPIKPATPLDWSERVSKLTDDMIKRLAEWRGYSEEFCFWLREIKAIGSYGGTYCFPIYNSGHVVRFHVRWPSGLWQYQPARVSMRLTPLVIGSGRVIHVFESQWDAFAVMSVLPIEYISDCRWVATRGSGNGSGRADYIWRQNDNTPEKRESEKRWANRFDSGEFVRVPERFKDANEWLQHDKDWMKSELEKMFL